MFGQLWFSFYFETIFPFQKKIQASFESDKKLNKGLHFDNSIWEMLKGILERFICSTFALNWFLGKIESARNYQSLFETLSELAYF